jgi:hypothetical protein
MVVANLSTMVVMIFQEVVGIVLQEVAIVIF